MGKMIVVSREKLEEGMRKFEERQAKDPRMQEEQEEMERFFAKEDARRKAAHEDKKAQKE